MARDTKSQKLFRIRGGDPAPARMILNEKVQKIETQQKYDRKRNVLENILIYGMTQFDSVSNMKQRDAFRLHDGFLYITVA
jgi:hypothetical protein